MLRSLRLLLLDRKARRSVCSTLPTTSLLHNLARSTSSGAHSQDNGLRSLTVPYIESSCGLSSESAVSASRNLLLQSTKKADSVLGLLRHFGFSEAQIATVVSKLPRVLRCKPDKNLRPKLEYLRGATGDKLTGILSVNPYILCRHLERVIMVSVDCIRSLDPSGSVLEEVLKSNDDPLMRRLAPNIEILKKSGATNEVVLKMLKAHTRSIMGSTAKLSNAIEVAKGAGVDPTTLMFAYTVGVMSYISKSKLERKMELFRRSGWSEEEITFIIKRQPNLFTQSEELFKEKLRFFKEVLGWEMVILSANPVLLKLAIDKNVRPRCAVLNILMSRDLVKKNRTPLWYLTLSGNHFFAMFVERYKEKAPEVVDAFLGKVNFRGWDWIPKHAGAA